MVDFPDPVSLYTAVVHFHLDNANFKANVKDSLTLWPSGQQTVLPDVSNFIDLDFWILKNLRTHLKQECIGILTLLHLGFT